MRMMGNNLSLQLQSMFPSIYGYLHPLVMLMRQSLCDLETNRGRFKSSLSLLQKMSHVAVHAITFI